uniref:Uncharacterized protein n=1 Tax=Panagrolaimus davidi TaxID=227884 RepID=A0A914PC56_9BILA
MKKNGNESNSSSRISTGGSKIIFAGSCLRPPTTTANKKASTLYISEKEAMTWTPYPKYDGFTICEETRQRLLESIKGSSILSTISPPGCPDLVPRSFASVEDVKCVRLSQRNVPMEMVQTEMSLEDYLKDVKIDYSKVFKQRNRPRKNRSIWCNKVWTFDKVGKNLEYFEVINNKVNAMVKRLVLCIIGFITILHDFSRSTQIAPVVARQTLPRSSFLTSASVHRRAGLQLSVRRNTVDSNELVATEKERDGRLDSMQRNVAKPSARKTLLRKTASKTRKRHVPTVAVPQDKEANRKAPPKKKRNVSFSLNVPSKGNASRKTVPTKISRQTASTAKSRPIVLNTASSAATTKNTRTNASNISSAVSSARPAASRLSSTGSRITRATPISLPFSTYSPQASNTRSRINVLNTPSSSLVTTMNSRTNASAIVRRPLAALKLGSTASKTTSRAIASTIHPKPALSNNRSTSQATKRCINPAPVSPSRQHSPPASNTRFRQAVVQQLIQASSPPCANINERSKRQRKPKKPFEL